MAITLSKGQSVNLSKSVSSIQKVRIGLGWDAAKSEKKGLFGRIREATTSIDCDASAILLENDRLTSRSDLVYFGNKSAPGVQHSGDNLTGEGAGDDETILVDLASLENRISSVEFIVNIYSAESRKQHFGMIQNAYIRVVNPQSGEELARYSLTEDYAGALTLHIGRLVKVNGEWTFQAVGEGTGDASIRDFIQRYNA